MTNFVVSAYSDADWAGDQTRRSTGGYLIFCLGGVISWKCSLIRSICLSSLESEIVFLSRTCKELVWLIRLFASLGFKVDTPITVLGDNQGALAAAKNEQVSERTKHIEIADLYVRQAVEEGWVKADYVPTDENTADILTKPLGPLKFAPHADALLK
jgi:hypothetical protein